MYWSTIGAQRKMYWTRKKRHPIPILPHMLYLLSSVKVIIIQHEILWNQVEILPHLALVMLMIVRKIGNKGFDSFSLRRNSSNLCMAIHGSNVAPLYVVAMVEAVIHLDTEVDKVSNFVANL